MSPTEEQTLADMGFEPIYGNGNDSLVGWKHGNLYAYPPGEQWNEPRWVGKRWPRGANGGVDFGKNGEKWDVCHTSPELPALLAMMELTYG